MGVVSLLLRQHYTWVCVLHLFLLYNVLSQERFERTAGAKRLGTHTLVAGWIFSESAM